MQDGFFLTKFNRFRIFVIAHGEKGAVAQHQELSAPGNSFFFFEVAKEGDRPGGGCVFFVMIILLLFCLVLKSFMLLFHFTAGQKKIKNTCYHSSFSPSPT